MALTEEQRGMLEARLTEAEGALHQLTTGRQRVKVRTPDGDEVGFTPANALDLRVYIAELKLRLGRGGSGAIHLEL